MKNLELLASINGGALVLKSNGLSSDINLTACQIRKYFGIAFRTYLSDAKAIREEVGIENIGVFTSRIKDLSSLEKRTEEEESELTSITEKAKKHDALLMELINKQIDLSSIKPLPFSEWRKLVDANTDENGESPLSFNDFIMDGEATKKVDVELALEGIAWYAPEENSKDSELGES